MNYADTEADIFLHLPYLPKKLRERLCALSINCYREKWKVELETNRLFGQTITRLINKENLSEDEAYDAFCKVLNNQVNDMQQGAFLAALTSKGETAQEVAGGWRSIYELDTNKVDLSDLTIVDNCGTGMDSFKTFNISTAASLVAATAGVHVARHGARAISSSCGTVDMAEMLGVDVDCPVELVAKSIRETGVGLFNGMSPTVHPMALGRILSQICFGSPLNIAASLAHPAMPKLAVRGVYSKNLLLPVAKVMQQIGYSRALVVYGEINNSHMGMDEVSACGKTLIAELHNGEIREYAVTPKDFGFKTHAAEKISADTDRDSAAVKMYGLLAGKGEEAPSDTVALNAGFILYLAGTCETLQLGVARAKEILLSGAVISTLQKWVETQNSNPTVGLEKLEGLAKASRKS